MKLRFPQTVLVLLVVTLALYISVGRVSGADTPQEPAFLGGTMPAKITSGLELYSVWFLHQDLDRAPRDLERCWTIIPGHRGRIYLRIEAANPEDMNPDYSVSWVRWRDPTGDQAGIDWIGYKEQSLRSELNFYFSVDLYASEGIYKVEFEIYSSHPTKTRAEFTVYFLVDSEPDIWVPSIDVSWDPIPLSINYGDETTIRLYLRNNGTEDARTDTWGSKGNGLQIYLENGEFTRTPTLLAGDISGWSAFDYDNSTDRDVVVGAPIIEVYDNSIAASEIDTIEVYVKAKAADKPLNIKIQAWMTEFNEWLVLVDYPDYSKGNLIYRYSQNATAWPFNGEWVGSERFDDTAESSTPIASITVNKASTSATIEVDSDEITLGQSFNIAGTISSPNGVSGNTAVGNWYIENSTDGQNWGNILSGAVSESQTTSGFSFNIPSNAWTPSSSGVFYLRVRYEGDPNYEASESEHLTVEVKPPFVSLTVNTSPAIGNLLHFRVDDEDKYTDSSGTFTIQVRIGRHTIQLMNTTVTKDTNIQYRFRDWSGIGSGSDNPISLNVETASTLTANFDTYYNITFTQSGVEPGRSITITVNDLPHSGTTPYSYSDWFKEGGSIQFDTDDYIDSATSGKRYAFSNWKDKAGTIISSPQTASKPDTFTAHYMEQYQLTVDTQPTGLDPQPTISPLGPWYDAGTTVICEAQQVQGYVFGYWILDGTQQEPGASLTVKMDAPHVANAYYRQLTRIELTPGSTTVKIGDTQTFKAEAYDQDDNKIDGLTYTWTVSGGIGSLNPTSGQNTMFTATTVGIGSISATTSYGGVTKSGTITVIVSTEEDKTPPVITHTPVTTGNEGEEITILADITDDFIVSEAKLYYKKTGQTSFIGTMMEISGNMYRGIIPKDMVTIEGIQYYINATDGRNFKTTQTYKITIHENPPPQKASFRDPAYISETSVRLAWSQCNEADFARYEIYQSTSPGSLGTKISTITDMVKTSLDVTGLSLNTKYYFTCRVVDRAGLYADSDQLTVQTSSLSNPIFPWIYLVFLVPVTVVLTYFLFIRRRRS